MPRAATLIGCLLAATALGHAHAGSETVAHGKGRAEVLCEAALDTDGMCDLNGAFAALWLNRDPARANQRLRAAYAGLLDGAQAMTPELADQKAKWQMRTWIRAYYLFSSDSAWFPGRLEAETQGALDALLWNYGIAKSSVARAGLEYVWFLQGSENHDMMDLANAFLALQALAGKAPYRDRPLPDGHTAADHVAAWTAYFTRYCEERVKHGLFVEAGSPTYGKYLIPELVNLYDFAEDAELRRKAEVLLHVTWADWAVEQLACVRGGAKARCYQGNYSRRGAADSWRLMGQLLLGQGDWANASHYTHPILGYGFILATSRYELPPVIAALARSPADRGEYAYISRRPGRMAALSALPPLGGHRCWYAMDAADSRLVRYTWCTPGHVMGCFLVDPALGVAYTVDPAAPEAARNAYAAISGQNRWQGVVFATGPDARIFPQCVGRPDEKKPGLSATDIQHVAVQHENVMLVQMSRAETRNTATRVYFSPGMKERLHRRDGWAFLTEGASYAAVRVQSRKEGRLPGAFSWDDGSFLRADDTYAPLIFATGRTARFPNQGDFEAYVLSHDCSVTDGALDYIFEDSRGQSVKLRLYVDERRLPEVNRRPVDLAPESVYDCPFLQSVHGSGALTVAFGGERLVLSVNGDRP